MDTGFVARRPLTRPPRGWVLRHRSPLWGMGAVFSSRHRPPLRGRDVVCAQDHPPRGGRPAVVGALCSAQSHPIPAGSRFFILAPSGPLGGQLRGAARPPPARQTHPPAPDRSPLPQQARPPRVPTSSPNGAHVQAQSPALQAPGRGIAPGADRTHLLVNAFPPTCSGARAVSVRWCPLSLGRH